MRVPFRQGIVSAPANFLNTAQGSVNLVVPPGEYLTITFADGTTDYLLNEGLSVTPAWTGPFYSTTDYWLYWDIDVASGAKTYGYTTVEPVAGPTAPTTSKKDDGTQGPLRDKQMWFDTSVATMFEYNITAQRWIRKVRVFAAELINGTTFVSLSINSPTFTGTQAGMQASCQAGSLVFDSAGRVIRKSDGTFYTTEDVVSTGIGSGTQVKLESIAISAMATANISAYTMVRLIDFNQIAPATNMLADAGIYGLIEQDVTIGEIVTVVREGVVVNPDWAWPDGSVNAPIFVRPDGVLTTQPQPSRPVGLIVGRDSILLTATIVDDISLVESAVTITGPSAGVTVTGSSGSFSSSFAVSLTDDLAALEALTTTGIAHRTGNGNWTAGPVLLTADVVGTLPTTNGGTGTPVLSAGFVRSTGVAGQALFSSETVPGELVSGDIPGNATGIAGGVVSIINGGTGAISQPEAINALTPTQSPATAGQALISDGANIQWGPVATGTVQRVGVTSSSPGVAVTNSPITTTGDINISLTGNLQSIDQIVDSGFVSVTPGGSALSHTVSSSTNTVVVGNGDGSATGPLDLNLPAVNTHGQYAEVIADQYGRVIWGSSTLAWTKISGKPTTLLGYGIIDAYTKAQTDAHTWDWSSLYNVPTTVAGYGITDTYTKAQTDAHTWNWSAITATPTTIAGYGIVDAVKDAGGVISLAAGATINKPAAGTAGRLYVDTTTSLISYDNGGTWLPVGGTGTVTSVTIASVGQGIAVTNDTVTTTGTISVGLADDLAAIEALATTGFAARTGADVWETRSIIGTSGAITVTNGDGVAGNVILGLPDVVVPGAYYNVIVDAKGRVTSGTTTFSLDWNSVTNKPTTVAGYAITDAITTAMVGQANGVCSLDSTGKIPQSQLPPVAITDVFVCASQSAMLALDAQVGDVAIRTDESKTYILRGGSPTVMANWSQILAPAGGGGGSGVTYVQSVSNNNNLTITGGPVLDIGTFTFDLAGNLARVAALPSVDSGILRAGTTWTTGNVSLTTEVAGILPVTFGGTGTTTLTGYLKGNGTSAFTSVAKIPAADIDGSIVVDGGSLTGVVAITNGGTGQTTRSAALNGLLPLQTAGVFVSDGTIPSWTTSIPSNYISGAVPNAISATTANNALALGGVDANQFVTATGNNATGTWNISVSGSAASAATAGDASLLNGHGSSYFATATGVNASGTWNIDIAGNAATVDGYDASAFALADGSNIIGPWTVSTTGTSANVTGVVSVANGGTGSSTAGGAINNLLPSQGSSSGKFLSTDGVSPQWVALPASSYNTIQSSSIGVAQRNTMNFDVGFTVVDNVGAQRTDVGLHSNLIAVADDTYLGAETIDTVGTIAVGTWQGTAVATAHGGTGLDLTGVTGYLKVVNGVIQALDAVNTQQTIAAGAYYEYDTWTTFGNSFDARQLVVTVTVLDSDNTSATYNMYINSEAVATVAIKDQRYIRVYNDYSASLTFYITARA